MKKTLIFISCLILGSVFGCLFSIFLNAGGNTFWKPIDYFPHPVEQIIAMKAFGGEFWVETTDNDVYQITYPCPSKQDCWELSDEIPTDLTEGEFWVDFLASNNKCENHNFVYPLFDKINSCYTSVVNAESFYTTSLALTNKNKLWIWNKPWKTPNTTFTFFIQATIVGAIIGIFVGLFLTERSKEPSLKKEK